MSKQVKTVSMLLALSALSVGTVNAGTITSPNAVQNVQTDAECKGVVIDATGEPMIGASVVVKGKTGLGTVTDIDGNFTLKNVNKGEIIRITSLGMNPVEVAWEGKALKVTMKDDSKQINEVVVTALGIKRERKSLGYAIQDVKGDAISTPTRTTWQTHSQVKSPAYRSHVQATAPAAHQKSSSAVTTP